MRNNNDSSDTVSYILGQDVANRIQNDNSIALNYLHQDIFPPVLF